MTWLAQNQERLARYRAGDRATLAEVYEHYAPGLAKSLRLGFTARCPGGPKTFSLRLTAFDVDDVVQESFIRAMSPTARKSFDGSRSFSAYLSGVCRNVLIDRFRKTSREPSAVDLGVQQLEDQPSGSSPEQSALLRELKLIYREFLGTLSPTDRDILRLRYEERLPRRVVCAHTHLTPMQLRTREKHLRSKLYNHLKSHGYNPSEPQWVSLQAY